MADQFIIYLVRSGICLMVFYLIYFLFFRKETFFQVSRFYLLSAAILSLIIPLIPISLQWTNGNTVYYYVLETITVGSGVVESTINNHIGVFEAILIVYFTGLSLFFLRFVFQLFQLMLLVRKNGIDRKEGIRLVYIDKNISPFSFFNLLFINKAMYNEENREEIIEHEKIHIDQKHTYDLILLEFVTMVQWFNPVVWFYRNSVKSTHEFLADEGVLLKGYDSSTYRNLLLNLSMGIQVNGLANNFNHSLLKRRIIMMTKTKGKAGWRLFMALPSALVLAFIFSITFSNLAFAQADEDDPPPPPKELTADGEKEAPPPTQVNDIKPVGEEVSYKEVEEAPEFKGGQKELVNFIVKNITYPEKARQAGITGTVYISYVIEKNGEVTNAKVKRGIGGGCDEEALRIINLMPPWEPGKTKGEPVRVAMTLPLIFNLDDGPKKSDK